jgi:hypothetical protein
LRPAIAGATHPAAPKPLPYAGLSADHPGYDAGEISGSMAERLLAAEAPAS